MVSFNSFIGISTGVLLLQSLAFAAPVEKKQSTLVRRSGSTGRFLHITDIHIDPNYKEGADIDDYCHKSKKRSSKAGKFGALGSDCDSPPALIDATFEYLKNNINDIDFIIYTGDTVRHDRDDKMPRTSEEVQEGHKAVFKYFSSTYPVSSIPYIPTIGNNDAFEHNQVEKNDKIYSTLANIWAPLNLNLGSDFHKGGYFVQDVIAGRLSVVNMNTMYFYTDNGAIDDCSSSSSPAAVHMEWLESTLKSYAAKKTHKLYLMGHVPPVDDDGSVLYKSECYNQYMNLLGKYSDVIVGHFTGHTNDDTLNAVYKDGSDFNLMSPDNSASSKALVGLFNAPSVLPKNNPAFRVYTYETGGSDYPVGTILNWEQYYVDLEKANDDGEVEYQIEYIASDLYNVNHFDGPGIGSAVNYIADNGDAHSSYQRYAKVSS